MHQIRIHLKIMFVYTLIIFLFLAGTVLGSHVVTVIAETTAVPRNHCIILDAGHGGEDGGAASCSGKHESSINLAITLRLNDLLHLLGQDTILIRDTDTAVYTEGETILQKKVSDLKERVRRVNRTPNGILVSIHQNYFPDERYHGAQVFYANSEASRQLAQALQERLISTINPGSHREIKQGSGIYLLEKIQRPGILVECGFLSCPQEEMLLCSESYQQKLCCVLACGIRSILA